MKRKKYLLISFILIAVFASSILYFNNHTNSTAKFVGSSEAVDRVAFRMPISSIDQLIEISDLIVIGEVISDGESLKKEFDFPNQNLKEKALKDSNSSIEFGVTHTKVKIIEEISGSSDSDVITISQLGKAGNDAGETKVKNGEKMLLILKRHKDDPNIYSSVDFENGLFRITNEKIISLSNDIAVSKYDNKRIDRLIEDIRKVNKQ